MIEDYSFKYSLENQSSLEESGLFLFVQGEPDPSDLLRCWWESLYDDYDFYSSYADQTLNWTANQKILCTVDLQASTITLYDEERQLVRDFSEYCKKINSLILFS